MTDSTRDAIRQAKTARAKAELRRAEALNAPLTTPAPNEQVRSYLNAAAKQRQRAAVAVDRTKRREFERLAKENEDAAQAARQAQLDRHWQHHATTETLALAEARGDEMEEVDTIVENGVTLDRRGVPQVSFEHSRARRRKPGLEHVREKGRLTTGQYETGLWFGELCAAAAVAEIAGKEEIGVPAQPACKPSAGPAGWKLDAVGELGRARAAVHAVLPGADAILLLRLLTAVCYEGQTPRAFAGGDERDGIRAEERLAMGLAILRQWRLTPAPGAIQKQP